MEPIKRMEVPIEIRALKTANVYLLNNSILFDTGMSENSYNIIKNNIDVKNIDKIVISHLHIDHIGGAASFYKNHNIPAYISSDDYDYIKRVDSSKNDYFESYSAMMESNGVPDNLLRQILKFHPMIKFFDYYKNLELNKIDFNIENFDIINVPGHSPGSIVLYSKQNRSLLSGDHLLGNITPNISVYSVDHDYLGLYLNSLEKIKNLDVDTVYPGHGLPFNNYRERINEIQEHHKMRIEKMLRILDGYKTVYQIASEIEWSKSRHMETMTPMEQNFAIMETMAHVIYMRNHNIIIGDEIKGLKRYITN